MKNNQKINLPAVVEDDVSFFHQAAMAMRQGLATAAMRVEDRAAALRQQVASTKSAIAARPIVSDYSRKINSGGSFPVRVNGQWVYAIKMIGDEVFPVLEIEYGREWRALGTRCIIRKVEL